MTMTRYFAVFYTMLLVNFISLSGMQKLPFAPDQISHYANIFDKLHQEPIQKTYSIFQVIQITKKEALALEWALQKAKGHLVFGEAYSIREEKNTYQLVRSIGLSFTKASRKEIIRLLTWVLQKASKEKQSHDK